MELGLAALILPKKLIEQLRTEKGDQPLDEYVADILRNRNVTQLKAETVHTATELARSIVELEAPATQGNLGDLYQLLQVIESDLIE